MANNSEKALTTADILRQQVIGKVNLFYEITSWNEDNYNEYDKLLKELKIVNTKKKKKRKRKKTVDIIDEVVEKLTEEESVDTQRKGKALEDIVNFIIEKSFMLKLYKNKRTKTHEMDQFVVLSDFGKQAMHEYNFSPELLGFSNGYFLGECKNYHEKVSSTWVGKFYTLLRVSGECQLGILFSYHGLKGEENGWYSAHGLTKVIYRMQPDGHKIFILDFNINDFEILADRKIRENFFKIIQRKKESLVSNAKLENLCEIHENEQFVKEISKELK